jgi:hypothetical protein
MYIPYQVDTLRGKNPETLLIANVCSIVNGQMTYDIICNIRYFMAIYTRMDAKI